MSYDVCVIIPAYHAEATLPRAVASLTRQGPLAIQTVICADDDRDYAAILAGAGIDGADIVHCRTLRPASGPAQARNTALALAQADIIAPLDADDEFVEGRLPALIGTVGQCGAACGPTVEFCDGVVTRIARPQGAATALTLDDICRLRMPFVPVFRRRLAPEGWPLVSYAEDVVLNVELLTRARSYAFVNEAAYAYHVRQGSLSNDANTLERARQGYAEILAYIARADWPDTARNVLEEVIREDMAMVEAASGIEASSRAGAWREAWKRKGNPDGNDGSAT